MTSVSPTPPTLPVTGVGAVEAYVIIGFLALAIGFLALVVSHKRNSGT